MAHHRAWAAPRVLAALATDGGIPLPCAEGGREAGIRLMGGPRVDYWNANVGS